MIIKGGIVISSEITKKQFNNSVINFINRYRRLPFLLGDEVEFNINKDDEEKKITYRASTYIEKFYGTRENMSEELLSDRVITHKLIADTLGVSTAVIRNAISKDTANPRNEVRRGLDIFFGKDLYEKELGSYNKKCTECTKRCKQHYWVEVVHCSMYDKK